MCDAYRHRYEKAAIMKAFLRAVLSWMDRKFPDRVVLTPEKYSALDTAMSQHASTLAELTARMVKLEFEVNKFNVTMGFGTRGQGVMGLER